MRILALVMVVALVGCGSGSRADTPDLARRDAAVTDGGVDASSPPGDAAPHVDAAPHDAGGAHVDLDGGTTIVVLQPISGSPQPTTTALAGPGVVLMGGGTDVDAAFVWMHDTIAGSSTAHRGNVVVLRADSNTDNAYTPYIYGLAPFQSVMTIYIGGSAVNETPATAADLAIAAYYVDRSDIVFFAGGDQADYVSWKGSPLMAAISALYARGGVVGGTSAGCAIAGSYVFDSVAADAAGGADVETADAVANPFESTISFTRDLFTFPVLPNVMTDMHFVTRDRFGRLAAFVARQYTDVAATSVLGIGVDESNALLVDKNGNATLVQEPSGTEAATGTGAYFLQPAGAAKSCQSGKALVYDNIVVTRLANPQTDSFNLTKGCGTGTTFTISVDGSSKSSPYSTSPYKAKGTASKCP